MTPAFFQTGDVTWVYVYDTETKGHVKNNIKSMLISFFVVDNKGIIHKEFVLPDQTGISAFYAEVLRHLQKNVRRKELDKW